MHIHNGPLDLGKDGHPCPEDAYMIQYNRLSESYDKLRLVLNEDNHSSNHLLDSLILYKESKGRKMRLNKKQKTVLMRGLRYVAHTLIGALAAWVVGPEAVDLLGPTYQPIVAILVTAVSGMTDKALRYGKEAGEDPAEKVLTLNRG